MTKQIFLTKLREGLYGLPQNDIEERVTFYSEMIDDRMEEGISQEDAVSEIGDVQNIVSQILMETPITKIVKEKVEKRYSRLGTYTFDFGFTHLAFTFDCRFCRCFCNVCFGMVNSRVVVGSFRLTCRMLCRRYRIGCNNGRLRKRFDGHSFTRRGYFLRRSVDIYVFGVSFGYKRNDYFN